jgi:pyruvate dehydrogenase E1 component alpha subunit
MVQTEGHEDQAANLRQGARKGAERRGGAGVNFPFFTLYLRLKSEILATTKTAATKFSKETYLYWYELMLLLRRFEERAGQLYGMQKIRGFCHLYIGQEALAAGCMTATKPDDTFITAYRDHGLALAKGISAKSCMAELYGKATGCSKGKGGSMHFFGVKERFFGGHGIVGAQIGTGAGLAFAEKYLGTDNVCLTFFGDGAARQGILHETANLAMTWKLPVIFICENNHYAMGTSVARTSNVVDIYKLADAYEMPGDSVDGMDPEAIHEAVSRAVKRARAGDGPTLLEMKTYRYKGHSMSDPQTYRTKEEVEAYKQKDPIEISRLKLLNDFKVSEDEIEAINERVRLEVEECVKFAEESPWPSDDELLKDVYVQQDYPFIVD